MGYETYQKILAEAVIELKTTEYKELFADQDAAQAANDVIPQFVADTQIDTDEEILFPEAYISSIPERMRLYKELDSMNRDEDIDRFALELTDRFGSIPPQAAALLEVVKVRIRAQKIGIERAILKNGQVSFYFVSDQRSAFYQSPVFAAVINWIQSHPRKAQLKQVKDKLIMTIKDVPDIANLRALVDDILASCAAPSTTK